MKRQLLEQPNTRFVSGEFFCGKSFAGKIISPNNFAMLTFQNLSIKAPSLSVILFKFTSNYKLRESRFRMVSFVFSSFKLLTEMQKP